jgi:hypothetical protein
MRNHKQIPLSFSTKTFCLNPMFKVQSQTRTKIRKHRQAMPRGIRLIFCPVTHMTPKPVPNVPDVPAVPLLSLVQEFKSSSARSSKNRSAFPSFQP